MQTRRTRRNQVASLVAISILLLAGKATTNKVVVKQSKIRPSREAIHERVD